MKRTVSLFLKGMDNLFLLLISLNVLYYLFYIKEKRQDTLSTIYILIIIGLRLFSLVWFKHNYIPLSRKVTKIFDLIGTASLISFLSVLVFSLLLSIGKS